jgi:hypothetical protein
MSATSGFLTATLRSASSRITLSCTAGTCFSLSTWTPNDEPYWKDEIAIQHKKGKLTS